MDKQQGQDYISVQPPPPPAQMPQYSSPDVATSDGSAGQHQMYPSNVVPMSAYPQHNYVQQGNIHQSQGAPGYVQSPPIYVISGGLENTFSNGQQYRNQLFANCAQGNHQVQTRHTALGIIMAVLFFPIGLVCLFADVRRVCTILASVFLLTWASDAQKIVLTNDDGWATAQIRAEYEALKAAGFDVIISAPAENQSGTGSSSTTPTTLTSACEFNTCPAGSPATGSNATDPNQNYVNAFPVDAARFGIQTLSPQIFGSAPDLVISGSNIGASLGLSVLVSGTIGAAVEAVKEGIPSIAFSGSSGSQVSFTTLSNSTAPSTIAANIYSDLIIKFVNALLDNPAPILPSGTSVNVNFAAIDSCPSSSSFKFVFTRIFPNLDLTKDVNTCGTDHLPLESSAIKEGCIATVSAFDTSNKLDVNAATQQTVLNKISSILSCL